MHGKRVRAGGNIGTVRWGPSSLPTHGEDVLWLGVEFDEAVGKHDGTGPDGVRRFECPPSKGSFVKLERADTGISFADAVTNRYTNDVVEDLSLDCGRKVELVGREKALEKRLDMSNLTLITLKMERVATCGSIPLDSLVSLALDGNLLSSWNVVHDICRQCPKLENLSIVSNRLICEWDPTRTPLDGIRSLVARDTGIHEWQWPVHWFPNLEELNVGKNHVTDGIPEVSFPKLRKLTLDDNEIRSWGIVNRLNEKFPLLTEISLNHTALPDEKPAFEVKFPSGLQALSIADNDFRDWTILAWLAENLPQSVIDIKALHNGIADGMGDINSSMCRQLFIALLPQLVFINGSQISPIERTNSERVFLAMAAGNTEVFLAVDPNSTHRTRLELKHGRGIDAHSSGVEQQAPLASQLVKVKFQPDGRHAHKAPVERKIPMSMEIREVKALCKRLFKMTNVRLALVEAGRPTPTLLSDEDFREIGFWSIADGCEIRIEEVE